MPSLALSVVIPTYNVESYIAETLDSLIAQSVPALEIIVVNDGSTDGTLELLETRYGSLSNLKVHTQENQGVGAARLKGLEMARGDYVFFCDPDDVISPTLFHDLSAQVSADPQLELYYFSKRSFIDKPEGRQFLRRDTATTRQGLFEHGRDVLQDLILSGKYNASTWQYIFKRTVCERFDVRFEGRAHEDHWFSMNIYLHSQRSFATRQDCYFQRVRAGSLTQSAKDQAYVASSYYAYRDTLVALKAHIHRFSQGKRVALNFMERNVSALITKCIKYGVMLPENISSRSRRDARDCNIGIHGRVVLLLPRLIFRWRQVRQGLRVVSKSIRCT